MYISWKAEKYSIVYSISIVRKLEMRISKRSCRFEFDFKGNLSLGNILQKTSTTIFRLDLHTTCCLRMQQKSVQQMIKNRDIQ